MVSKPHGTSTTGRTAPLRIIVSGLCGLIPLGGVAWDYLQYVIGLADLGHDVYYFEDTWEWPYDPIKNEQSEDGTYSAGFIDRFFQQYAPELRDHWHYRHLHQQSFGMSESRFDEASRSADIFLNVSGSCIIPDHLSPHCVKVFLDTDPGFTQIGLSEKPGRGKKIDWRAHVCAHDLHFTYGENMHSGDCLVPNAGFSWKTTRVPMVTRLWATTYSPPAESSWTTVMTWSAFKRPLYYQGVEYKSKDGEFERIIDLPKMAPFQFQIAVGGATAPFDRIKEGGWDAIDGPTATLTPESYRRLIYNSRGEISTAKHVYVQMRTGWFSCRSACYLAAGKPVVVQDTGFSNYIPTGRGLLSFRTAEEAIHGIQEVESNYREHCKAAKEMAQEYLSSRIVLERLLADIEMA
jgi:hypothetical protein